MANNYTVINSTGGTVTMKSIEVSTGVQAVQSIPTDSAGAPMLTGASCTATSSFSGQVVTVSPNSAPLTTRISSGTITLSSAATVALSSVATITPSSAVTVAGAVTISSGTFAIINGANTAAVKAASTAPSSSDPALVVAISPNGVNPNGQALMADSAPVVIASNQSAVPTTVSSGIITLSSNPTVFLSAAATGGATRYSVIISSGTNSTLVSSAACQLYKVEAFNSSTTLGYLKLYNLSSAPTAGSSLVVQRYLVPGSATGSGFISTIEVGVPFTTGLSYTFTGGILDADTTAVSSNQFILNLYYK